MKMHNIAVIGGQWGDEGKGKIVDLITDRFDVVARFQGGPNAGHSVKIGEQKFSLHHIPSGIFHEKVSAVLGNGMVIDLERLWQEIDNLKASNISLEGRLFISERAHVILPIHKQLDDLSEKARRNRRIGTTKLGIGPAYQSKMNRSGIRVVDLKNRDFLKHKVKSLYEEAMSRMNWKPSEIETQSSEIAEQLFDYGKRIEQFVMDTCDYLNEKLIRGSRVLFEGAQGTLLDIDSGSYPFVTSSSTTASGISGGLGISPKWIHGIAGVFKSYTTRVGFGPFPSEEKGEVGEKIRELGQEFGTTTGRARRCGWFDAVAARYSSRINQFDGIALTLLDVLSYFDEIKICTKYRYNGQIMSHFPSEPWVLNHLEPVYEVMEGWKSPISDFRDYGNLPSKARKYIERISEVVGCEVGIISVGPERSQSIIVQDSLLSKHL
jgi:adenylosuccinate synthase